MREFLLFFTDLKLLVISWCCERVKSPNDEIKEIEKKLNETPQKTKNKGEATVSATTRNTQNSTKCPLAPNKTSNYPESEKKSFRGTSSQVIEVAILILDHPTLQESFSLLTFVGILGRESCWGNPFGRYEYPPEHHYTWAGARQGLIQSRQPSCVHWGRCSEQNEGRYCTGCPSVESVVP